MSVAPTDDPAAARSGERAPQTRPLDFVDDDAMQAAFREQGWTDGLPIVAPTPQRVEAMLDWSGYAADQVVGVERVKDRALIAEKVAINAVMAGCLAPDFPVVATAVQALCEEKVLVHGATASTAGCAILLIVNGPIRQQLGMSSAHSALAGPDRASMCIGRAVRLVLRNLLEVRPGELDRSTIGHPGKLSWCVAEDEEGGRPWLPLGVERGMPPDVSSVTVLAASGPRQVMNEWTTDPHELATTYVAEIKASMLHYSIWPGNYVLVVPPQSRNAFHAAGWSKADLRQFVFEHARVRRSDWEGVGKGAVVSDANRDNQHAALNDPEDLLIVSAGGDGGGFAAIIPPWFGPKSSAATAPVGVCVDC
jgi:hypothetical protein